MGGWAWEAMGIFHSSLLCGHAIPVCGFPLRGSFLARGWHGILERGTAPEVYIGLDCVYM
jgi:hypothetical protein